MQTYPPINIHSLPAIVHAPYHIWRVQLAGFSDASQLLDGCAPPGEGFAIFVEREGGDAGEGDSGHRDLKLRITLSAVGSELTVLYFGGNTK